MEEHRYTTGKMLLRLLVIARPYWPHLAGTILLGFLAMPLTLLNPLPIRIVVDSVVGTDPLPEAVAAWTPAGLQATPSDRLLLAVYLLAAVAALTAIQWTSAWLLEAYTGEKLTLRLRTALFRHVQQLALTYHDRHGSSDSTYRIQFDSGAIREILMGSLIPLLTAGFPLAGIVVAVAFIDWQLALITGAVCPVLVGILIVFGRRLRKQWKTVKQGDSEAMSVVQEVLSSLRVVKAYGREDAEQQRFEARSNKRIRGQLVAIWTNCQFETLVAVTIGLGTAGVLFVGALHVQQGILSLGELLMVMAYIPQVFGPLQKMTRSSAGLAGGLASAERVFTVMDRVPDILDAPSALPIKRARGSVTLDDVSFAYPGGPVVLDHLSLEVAPGQRVGIQGKTGSGKSTLMSLLMRFYDPTSGRILLDGRDLRDYRRADLRQQMAMVLQEPVLFATTVRENIEYGRPGATQQEIEHAARLANAHDFIVQMPEGYGSEIGERGVTLSGGERQRIALARAFLRDAPILVLDEPTSSVDIHTEAQIMDAVNRLMEGRTTFLIAHRLSTLEQCDLRLELAGGKLHFRTAAGSIGAASTLTGSGGSGAAP